MGKARAKGASSTGPKPVARQLEMPRSSVASEKRRFMSEKVSMIRSKPTVVQVVKKGEEDTAEFKKTLKDVLNFVVPQMGRRTRRQYEEAKLRALGGTLEKRPFEPYAALRDRQKKEEAARQKRLEAEKTLGVSFSAHKQRRGYNGQAAMSRKEQESREKKKRKSSDILNVGVGRERRGMVVLPKSKVKKYA